MPSPNSLDQQALWSYSYHENVRLLHDFIEEGVARAVMIFKAVMPILVLPRLALENSPAGRLGLQADDNPLIENLQRLDGFALKPEPDAVIARRRRRRESSSIERTNKQKVMSVNRLDSSASEVKLQHR